MWLVADHAACLQSLPSTSLADGVHFEQPSSEQGCLGGEMLCSGRQGPDEEGKLGFRPDLQVTSEQAIHLCSHLGFPSTLRNTWQPILPLPGIVTVGPAAVIHFRTDVSCHSLAKHTAPHYLHASV